MIFSNGRVSILLLLSGGVSQRSSALVLPTSRRVCVIENDTTFLSESRTVAESLLLPLISDRYDGSESFSHALSMVEYEYGGVKSHALAIESLEAVDTTTSTASLSNRRRPKKGGRTTTKPFFIDLFPDRNSRMGKRSQGQAGTDHLIKAVAPKKVGSSKRQSGGNGGVVIFDLTAGFAQDSLILAHSGDSRIHMVERDPIVAALLRDALRRLQLLAESSDVLGQQVAELASDLSQRLTLEHGEGKDVVLQLVACLSEENEKDNKRQQELQPDVVYLDPMFPPRTKSASVKKNMQILHGLLETQQLDVNDEEGVMIATREEHELLEAALQACKARVVVKRPIRALALGEGTNAAFHKPSYSVNGSVNRFDVYLKQ